MLNAKLFSSVNIHREAVDWRNRVLTNGGRVSKDTLKAVSDFCYRIDAAGIRNKFSRLNLICGDDLTAARVPLYRGLSFIGDQYGNPTDTNNNFIDGDYTERGSNGGLNAGSGGTKYLDTGVIPNNSSGFTGINNHMSAYVMNRTNEFYIGCDDSYGCCAGGCAYMYLVVVQNGNAPAYIMGDNDNNGYYYSYFNNTSSVGLFLGCCDTGTSGANSSTYTNGVSDNNGKNGDMNSNSLNGIGLSITIFGYNHIAIDPNDYSCLSNNDTYGTGHISSYSFGPYLTYDQQLSYYNTLQAFQTALGRNK